MTKLYFAFMLINLFLNSPDYNFFAWVEKSVNTKRILKTFLKHFVIKKSILSYCWFKKRQP